MCEDFLTKQSLEVISDNNDKYPWCAHGPTLLFRITKNGCIKEYFACSAFRSRKGCNFYLEKQEYDNNHNKIDIKLESIDLEAIKLLRDNIFKFKPDELNYCHQCNVIFHVHINSKSHQNHESIRIASDLWKTPTKFLRPFSDDKAQAQYFFKDNTLNFLGLMLKKLHISKVVCIGAPRLHEYLKQKYDIFKIESILLDLDHRFFYFNSDSEFFYYNMFNNHFFEGQEKKNMFKKFLKIDGNETISVITDPPFGCRTEPLVNVLRDIASDFREVNNFFRVLPTIWIFPYYMEHYIKKEMPEMEMLDYKINYSNHEAYSDGINSRKYGSPVRLFTNIPLHLIELPATEGYKMCNICQKWTAVENIHCKICNKCPSKNGETYRHCNLCSLCVKPNYVHCVNCRRCTQKQNHNCTVFQKNTHCWICDEFGHLEVNCNKGNVSSIRKFLRNKEKKCRFCLICCKNGHNERKCKLKFK
ncbi:rRNA N6-adenosine-methyltransferase ZCCHC4, partial [Condylostylus longicornis]|uniref:rRNA N6-adenosine-methyltransferase ZCCHC4 n=1 Tax=Condylostylus longicornis TaxID=2530218 RepID=UPI00244E1E71